ncbi:uncharacterized protein LOC126900065 isoform X1 [Daktulosphaira vitifoliae]|uniref:uncharacterized protein LOC126900065 isoform X1 n=1 Tax=Daktulosphaira vitifoliae TaxID=58002 RepID=UPI0021A9946E|nr:uncharacterized protein LOC126900065 isoform X1 [Daktulosphaira vitifoliae]
MKTFKYICLVLFVSWYQLADCHPASTDLQSMDAMIEKESDIFLAAEADDSSHKSVRDKRTIGFLRQLFPQLSQIVDRKIQQITRFLFRVIGRLVLRGGAPGGDGTGTGTTGANNGGDSSNNGGRRISITLPTYPPLPDEEEEQSTEIDSTTIQSSPSSSAAPSAAGAESTTGAPVTTAEATLSPITSTLSPVTSTQLTPSDMDNQLSTDSAVKKKRIAREVSSTDAVPSLVNQKSVTLTETVNESSSINESSLINGDSEETDQEDSRNKRFSFNLGGGGGGGSGNFLFDLIRRGADRAARAAGSFYRVVAGTDPNTLTLKQPLQYPSSLVAGSGAPQDRDESSNSAGLEVDAHTVQTDATVKEDGYNVGVPGPLTRIFVLTNRGIANILKDLILRLAQTTERIVNFKARLITSLI